MDRRLFIGGAALGLATGAARGGWADPAAPPPSPPPASGAIAASVQPDDMVMGSPKAPVLMIEYASASCPHCARFNNDVFPAFKAKYVDTGRVLYVFREFLTPPVEIAAAAFLVARCAGPAKYFTVVDGMFHAQDEIYRTGELKGPLLRVAAGVGLDEKAVNACMTDQKGLEALNARVTRYADHDGVRATPTFLIGDRRLEGEQSLAALDAAVAAAEALAAAKATPKPRRRRHRAN
jgi:protein-disulfide isomerase